MLEFLRIRACGTSTFLPHLHAEHLFANRQDGYLFLGKAEQGNASKIDQLIGGKENIELQW